VGRNHATLKALRGAVTPERIASTSFLVTASTKYGKVIAIRVPLVTIKFFEIDEISLVLVVVVESPPQCSETLLSVKQVLGDAVIFFFGGGLEES